MPKMRMGRSVTLLASSSMVAIAMAAAPVNLDYQLDKPILKVAQADDSCFVAGTRVLMIDGTSKPIEQIRIGDLVMGQAGQANRVTGIEYPRLGKRRLYAINGGVPFFTAEHPFMTRAGWKSVDPKATEQESPALCIGSLAPGDLLAMAEFGRPAAIGAAALRAGTLSLAYRVLNRLDAIEADPDTPLFNLLLEGDHSYFANGYLVHNKDGGGEGGGGEGGGGGSGGSGSGGSGEGGEGGSGGSGEGGEGGNSGSGSSGEGGESGESGHSGGSDDSGHSESGESGESGDDSSKSGEDGESGESGDDSGRSGFGGVEQDGPDLSADQESDAISSGWQ